MLRAMTDARGATALDYHRCQLRGLVNGDLMPTPLGRLCIQNEIRRQETLRHARG
jgi:hypothetical protein